MLLTTMYQITTHTLIPKVKTFFDIDSIFLWYVKYWKERIRDEISLLYDTLMGEKSLDNPLILRPFLLTRKGSNCPNPSYFS